MQHSVHISTTSTQTGRYVFLFTISQISQLILYSGGVYASPSLAGSRYVHIVPLGDKLYHISFEFLRPGALIAGTWAAMQYLGSE